MESCGKILLRGPRNAFDYVLKVTSDGRQFIKLFCHRCVLVAHSPRLSELITNENFWDMVIRVKPGYVAAAIELIQFMYLKDVNLITDRIKVLELCGVFEMPREHAIINNAPLPVEPESWVRLTIAVDESECITHADFLSSINVLRGRLAALPVMHDVPPMEMMPSPKKKRKNAIAPRRRYNLRKRVKS